MSKEFNTFPLTGPQRSILIIEQFYPGASYNILCSTLRIKGSIQYVYLNKALNQVIENHDALRTRLTNHSSQIVQYFENYEYQSIDYYDFSYPGGDKDYPNWVRDMHQRPFAFYNSNLYYFAIIKFSNEEFGIFIKCHHIISDFWAFILLINQSLTHYFNLLNRRAITEEYTTFSYIDFINKEQKYLGSSRLNIDKSYWEGKIRKLICSNQFKSRLSNSIDASRKACYLSRHDTERIANLCSELNITPFILLVSAIAIYFWKKNGNNVISIGTTLMNRGTLQEKRTFGAFFNNLPFIIEIDPTSTYKQFLEYLNAEWFELLRHSNFSYVDLLKRYREIHKVKKELFDFSLAFLNAKISNDDYPVSLEGYFNHQEVNTLRINVNDMENRGTFEFGYDYSHEVLDEDDIAHIHQSMLNILNQALERSDYKLEEISLLSEAEKQVVLKQFNNTTISFEQNKNIVDLFHQQVIKNPKGIAVIFDGIEYSYEQIDQKSNQIARLLQSKSLRKDEIIGFSVQRSADLVIGILGILKGGAAYLPIDPSHPKERISYMLKDSLCRYLIVNYDQSLLDDNTIDIIDLRDMDKWMDDCENVITDIMPYDLANVIYTSGSTGIPKGVMIEHSAIYNLVQAITQKIDFQYKTVLSLTTLSFDIFFVETILPILLGLQVVIANSDKHSNPIMLTTLLDKYEIDIIQATPSRMSTLLNNYSEGLKNVSIIILGGEAVSQSLVKSINNVTKAKVYNGYGPTETTIYSSIKLLEASEEITIGKPIGNTFFYILNEFLSPVPVGAVGEIYISGNGLARGYLNKPELTDERFIDNPFILGTKMYKTGDLAKWRNDGEIIYVGRNDSQVKVRGYRIELGEIEHQLTKLDEVDQAVVTSNTSASRNYICAFFTGNKQVTTLELRDHLLKYLPDYMIPHKFMWLPSLPITPNGKIDRNALPDPNSITDHKESVFVAPRDEIESKIAHIWSEVLEVEEVGIDDNFFVLGGDSLAILEILSFILPFAWRLTAQDFYEYPTVRELAAAIKEKSNSHSIPLNANNLSQNRNNIIKNYEIRQADTTGNILLTGVTGFLGVHILLELILTRNVKIYCLIRDDIFGHKFQKVINFYAPDISADLIKNRVVLVNGDITKERLGLNEQEYQDIGQNIKTVIHSAALVKHFGLYSEFERVNVQGTKEIIDLCHRFRLHLGFISTTSVSGNFIGKQDEQLLFKETHLSNNEVYQHNVYVRSKGEAENLIINAVDSGLDATIFRVGVLTGRYSDGQFQLNIDENAFYRRLRSIFSIGSLPESVIEEDIEFTPIDYCSRAIVKLMSIPRKQLIYHIFNHNKVVIKDLLGFWKTIGIDIELVSDSDFSNIIATLYNTDMGKEITSGIIHDLIIYGGLRFRSFVEVNSSLTVNALSELDFQWPQIDQDYITKIIQHMRKVHFLFREKGII